MSTEFGSTDFPDLDFDVFHRHELPRRISEGATANAASGAQDLGSLGIRLQGSESSYTYRAHREKIEIIPGDEGADVLIELPQSVWQGLVYDFESPASLLYHGEVNKLRGDLMDFVQWEASLRALYTGRPVYHPDEVDLRDRRGDPLDPCLAFHLDDDREEMKHFLAEAGYLYIKDAFSPEEIEGFRSAADTLHGRATPGDRKSWWVKNREGENTLCRSLQAGSMPQLSGLTSDPRLLGLVDLAEIKMVPHDPGELDAVSVLWKLPEIDQGLADLPWHRDCGMGGHTGMCPTIVCSIFLGPNTPEAGQLRFLPGSWKSTFRVGEATGENALAGVLVPAGPGDLTIHYGDGWHAAPSPTSSEGPFRSSVLVSFKREGAYNHRGVRHYNDVLLDGEEGRVSDVREVTGRS